MRLVGLIFVGALASCAGNRANQVPYDSGTSSDGGLRGDSGALVGAETPPPARPVWLTVSGGGYHSHTAQTAWMMGMMAASGLDLDALTENVAAIASNSGGTWFVTQLAYSEEFRSALEDEPESWMSAGYLGQTEELFGAGDPCDGWSGFAEIICDNFEELRPIFQVAGLPGGSDLEWQPFVDEIVFGPFGMNVELAGTTLDGPKQPWADDKTLLFAGAMLTDEVVLAQEPGVRLRKDLYSASPQREGVPLQHNFTPVFFSTMDGNVAPPDFLAAGAMDMEYTTNAWFSPDTEYAVLSEMQSANVPVIIAATVSSAAAAAGASIVALDQSNVTDRIPLTDDEIAYILRDLAPAFEIDGGVKWLPSVPPYIEEQAARTAFRLGDGGYNDNTAVAHMLRYLVDIGALDDFEILAFMNTTGGLLPQGAPADVARLFGAGVRSPGVVDVCASGFCAQTMAPHVFESSAFDDAAPIWTYSDRGVTLNHLEIEVVTVDNPTFGIEAGHTGTLHVFVSQHGGSDILPLDPEVFQTYADVLDVTQEALVDHGGWDDLSAVLQVP